MKTVNTLVALTAALILSLTAPVLADVQLLQIVSGLTSPLFAGHAGDESNRLFIVEKGGVIKVLQPGASTPTVFLDIHTSVLSTGGEQGLLGLAFHPSYESNGRFFLYYTRTGGEIVLAEYHVSGNPNVADSTETILLTIPHPSFTNHNGGMLAFDNDNYLRVGVGDGGSGNDPSNNAQNLGTLLGKILRLDIDPAPGTGPYAIPGDNPFISTSGARPEIFAYGMRNPWRFSFDRLTHDQWVADVGQGAREEVDTPIERGGNYGWRVYEGLSCTGNDPALCGGPGYIEPRFEYAHSLGRCSITGGYVYRGNQNAVPGGTYLFGDYCTGEIFGFDGTNQNLLLDTTLNISSFGEDEAGEVYVVGLGGTVHKIVSTTPCTYAIAPTSQSFGSAGGTGSVGVTTGSGCGWSSVSNASWLHVTGSGGGSGNGSAGYSVDANGASTARIGTLVVAGQTFTVNQSGAATCTYAINPTRANFSNAGGTSSVTVTAGSGCAWTATGGESWLTITGGSSGSGNGVVTYSVAPYSGRQGTRNGRLTIAGVTFTVKQTR